MGEFAIRSRSKLADFYANTRKMVGKKKNSRFVTGFLLCFLGFGGLFCTAKTESNLHVDKFQGVDLEGRPVQLKDSKAVRLAINVYSPSCVPCYKEIPTLNYLYREMKEKNLGEFYMVVDPLLLVEEGLSVEETERKATLIMKEEIAKRGIELPVLIMRPPFKVDTKKGLVTGTPETLLFRTSPLLLYYNFIGSISEKSEISEIEKDSKVKFFKRILGGI